MKESENSKYSDHYIFIDIDDFKKIKLLNIIKEFDKVNPVLSIFVISFLVLLIGFLFSLKFLILIGSLIILIYFLYMCIYIAEKLC